jgi:ABC-type dipeptide/oligopeptide/nickel transport system permease subunit
MHVVRSRLDRPVARVTAFLKALGKNKRGLIGISILLFYVILALLAPVIANNDPVEDKYVAGDYAVPGWYKYLPGGENIVENFDMLEKPGFSTPESLLDWKFTTPTASDAQISVRYAEGIGSPSSGPGSAAIEFERPAGAYAGITSVQLEKEFIYPYKLFPTKFKCTMSFWAEDVENLESIDIQLILYREENETYSTRYPLWTNPLYTTSAKWIIPEPDIDSYASKLWVQQYFGGKIDPAKEIFSKPGNYSFQVNIIFRDEKPSTLTQDIEAKVYLDDLNMRFYGNAYGVLGTDQIGRDIFSQLVWGARISLFVGLLATVLSTVIGLLVGLVAGYLGGISDEAIMRFNDALLVIPRLPLLLVLAMVLGQSIWNLILLIGFLGWMGFSRVVRSQVLSLKERAFIEAAKASGGGKSYIMFQHVIPNVMSLVYVSLALAVPGAILSEASLSWLGLYDPLVMSWGRMLHDVTQYVGYDKLWWVMPPGISIAAISLSFILVGYALDDILNPRLRQRR